MSSRLIGDPKATALQVINYQSYRLISARLVSARTQNPYTQRTHSSPGLSPVKVGVIKANAVAQC